MYSLMIFFYLYNNLTTISDRICKKVLYTYLLLQYQSNSDCVTPTAWKFDRGIDLLLHLNVRKFQHNSLLTTEAMPLQSC